MKGRSDNAVACDIGGRDYRGQTPMSRLIDRADLEHAARRALVYYGREPSLDHEDVLQDLAEQVLRRRVRQGHEVGAAWRIARNLIRAIKGPRWSRRFLRGTIVKSSTPSPEAMLAARERLAYSRHAASQCTALQQAALFGAEWPEAISEVAWHELAERAGVRVAEMQRRFSGLTSQDEIGSVLGLSRGAVHSLRVRAREVIAEEATAEATPRKRIHPRLSENQVVDLRRRRAAGESLQALSDAFGVVKSAVSAIARGRRYATVAFDGDS